MCGVEMECERGYVVCAVTVVVKCEASVCVYVCMIYNFQQSKLWYASAATLIHEVCHAMDVPPSKSVPWTVRS